MIGRSLGHFEITAKLGEGGMGAVYRATDSKLGREVAIKVLPEAVTERADRLARFEREAKVLATLNHPHIAAIYEVGEAAEEGVKSVHFLAMELVEGEDLSERLRRGPIPVDEALDLAIQIAAALESAHERGIVHRDLKPANVRTTLDGQAKVLDFGLAKASEGAAGAIDMTHSPTLSAQMTQAGMLMGTAAYMSPEQARGAPADRRADVWAFGLLLGEMLSGRKAFDEGTVSDTLAAVLKSDPDLSGLPPELPREARRLLERCLRKDAGLRMRDMGDVRLELLEIRARLGEPQSAAEAGGPARGARSRGPIALAAVAGIAAALGAWWLLPSRPTAGSAAARVVRLGVPAPEGTVFIRGLALSPDGSKLAVTLRNTQGGLEIWVRSLDDLELRRLPGTEGGRFPFWSPDSRQLGFFDDYSLKVVDLIGSPPRTVISEGMTIAADSRGATWAADGTIVYAPMYIGGLMRVPAAGGEPEPATVLDPEAGNGTHRYPWFLPDGRHFVFYASSGSGTEPGQLRVGELGSTRTRFLTDSSSAAVLAAPDQLLFVRGEALIAQRLDLEKLELIGDPRQLGVTLPGGLAISGLRSLSASAEGTLAYLVESQSWTRLEYVARDGTVIGEIADPDTWHYMPRISPDGRTIAVARYAVDSANGDIWLFDRQRGLGRPLIADPEDDGLPVWSPDGRQLAYTVTASGQVSLFVTDLDGRRRRIADSEKAIFSSSWTPDGTGIVVEQEGPGGYDIAVVPLEGSGGSPMPILATRYAEWDGEISPDGRWLAYVSDASGRKEVFARPLDGSQTPWQVSTLGGISPRWSDDGTEITFISADDWMSAARVLPGNRFSTGPPERLFVAGVENEPIDRQYDVAPDGVFLVNRRSDDPSNPVTIVLGLDAVLNP